MASNSAAMTLEARVVQRLKDDTLMALVGDEDAMTDLVKRAITEALYAPRKRPGTQPWNDATDPAPVVEAAKGTAEKLCRTIMEELLADPVMKTKLRDLMLDMLPAAIFDVFRGNLSNMMEMAKANAVLAVQDMKRTGQI